MPIFRGVGGSGDASTDAYASQVALDAQTATTKANEAANSAAAASSSASAAASSESSVSADATAADNARIAAEAAQTAAELAETNAETAENNAADSASEAADTAATIGTLDSLSDVTITTVSTGEVLKYDGTEWVNGTASTVASLDDLTDVSVAGVTDGQALVYNSTSGDWEASTPASTSISTTAPVSPSAGDLWWNSESGQLKVYYTDVDGDQWVDAAASAANPSLVINDLTDVNITSVTTGDLLQYDGTDWVNSNAIDGTVIGGTTAAAGSFTTLTASSIDYPAADGTAGQVLVTDGSGTLSFTDAGAGDKIEEGNSSVEVVDAGTGYVAVTVDGTETARFVDNGDFKFNSGYGSVAAAYGCRAWVNFDGTGTVAIRDSGNVSSITDGGTGLYTVNFTTAMPDANYSAVVSGCESASTVTVRSTHSASRALTTTSFVIDTVTSSGSTPGGQKANFGLVVVSVFR